MASITINGITVGCTPSSSFNTLIEYKRTVDGSYTTHDTVTTNTDGTFPIPEVISGLDDNTCYNIRVTGDYPGSCGSFVENICTGVAT